MNDMEFMDMALELAEKGRGFTTPNPMVGAVIVRDSEVVGAGYHRRAGGPHAEVEALDEAGARAHGATLYVTLEPCNHTGRTPPCTEKILASGVTRVVAAMEDPNPGVKGGGLRRLGEAGIETVCGIGRERAERLNEVFLHHVRTGLPFVITKCASTLDGRIATRTGHSRWITGGESRAFVHRLRHAVDAILVGVGTVIADDPSLTTRIEGSQGRDAVRVVLDTHLRTPPDARMLHLDSDAGTFIICGVSEDSKRKRRLERTGARVLTAEVRDGKIALGPLMQMLGSMTVTSVLIEGGSRVLGEAFRSGVVDKSFFFLAPKILAGDDGAPICAGRGVDTMDRSIPVACPTVRRFGEDVMIVGYPRKT
jgi:diaminohydroxyphosphoribosylaminopyrimidine deaminase/5-amino-6-(5-phosphoribosylamino)uracil reductase